MICGHNVRAWGPNPGGRCPLPVGHKTPHQSPAGVARNRAGHAARSLSVSRSAGAFPKGSTEHRARLRTAQKARWAKMTKVERRAAAPVVAPENRASPAAGLFRGDHPKWIGDRVSYDGAHTRCRRYRGPARAHACIDCHRPALEWSFSHETPAGRTLYDDEGRPYSADPADYEPRCRRCHKLYDNHHRQAA